MVKWSRWKSIVAAVMVGFAEGTGLDVGRPDIKTPFQVVQIDESDTEIPWEWVPGLVIVPEHEQGLNAPDPHDSPPQPGWLKRVVGWIQNGLHRFDGIAAGPLPAAAPVR